jgi:PAS domain S-box-containing protein
MSQQEPVNILLVDDQPSKLLSYEVILDGLGENLLKASSGREALEHLLKSEVAVLLVDVCMPDLDGFQLAAMIREHPRFQKTAMIFISAIHLTELDRLRGYEMGAVDYVPVPVVPEVLRAKVKVFAELYRKTRQLERINTELEQRVAARTAELEASTARLLQSERGRSLALVAGKMGSWDWDCQSGECHWDDGQFRIFGVEPRQFNVTAENVRALIHAEDWDRLQVGFEKLFRDHQPAQDEFRIKRPTGETRWCLGTAAPIIGPKGEIVRVSGVTIDITDRKEAEERQTLLAREVDHRAKNALALVQSILRLTRAGDIAAYTDAVEGRVRALSRAHAVLSHTRWQGAELGGLVEEELAPYRTGDRVRVSTHGPNIFLQPAAAQSLALALHELATNAAKYGSLSSANGRVDLGWRLADTTLELTWRENGGPTVTAPTTPGFGTRIIGASIQGQLGGNADFKWRPAGLECVLSVPFGRKLSSPSGRANGPDAGIEAPPPSISIMGNRIMVVEDEALVSIALRDALDDLGFSVVGPFSKVADAIVALKHSAIDAAILDINLGGELVYPLAELLRAERIPFVFVTGYSEEGVDERFSAVPALQKPIDQAVLRSLFLRSKPTLVEAAPPRSAIA